MANYKCPNCGNTRFYAIELMRNGVILDENGEVVEENEVVENYFEDEWTCTNCEKVFESPPVI